MGVVQTEMAGAGDVATARTMLKVRSAGVDITFFLLSALDAGVGRHRPCARPSAAGWCHLWHSNNIMMPTGKTPRSSNQMIDPQGERPLETRPVVPSRLQCLRSSAGFSPGPVTDVVAFGLERLPADRSAERCPADNAAPAAIWLLRRCGCNVHLFRTAARNSAGRLRQLHSGAQTDRESISTIPASTSGPISLPRCHCHAVSESWPECAPQREKSALTAVEQNNLKGQAAC